MLSSAPLPAPPGVRLGKFILIITLPANTLESVLYTVLCDVSMRCLLVAY